ncbi:MAG: hypothetical protein Q9170_002421 [Blastenia crenularia]
MQYIKKTGCLSLIFSSLSTVRGTPYVPKPNLQSLSQLNTTPLTVPREFKVELHPDTNVPIPSDEIYRTAINMMYEVTSFPLPHPWLDRDWSFATSTSGIYLKHADFGGKTPSQLSTRYIIWGLNHLILSITLSKRYCQTIAILKWQGVVVGTIYIARREMLGLPWTVRNSATDILLPQPRLPAPNDEDISIFLSWPRTPPIARELFYLTAVKAMGDAAEHGLDTPTPALVTTSIQRMQWQLVGDPAFAVALRPRHSRVAVIKTLAKMQEDGKFQNVAVWVKVNGFNTAAGGLGQAVG